MHEAREAVAGGAAHAGGVRRVRLVEHDPARRVEGVQAGGGKRLGELLDARLVGDGGVGVGRARRRFGGVLAAGAVHLVELLGRGVVGLHRLVGDRPRGRDPAVVAQLAEVLGAHPVEGRAIQLGRPSNEVVNLRLEGLAGAVVPGVGRDVAVVHEHVGGRPVGGLAGQPAAALEQQDALARRREVARERAAAGAGADDDDVVGVHQRDLRNALGEDDARRGLDQREVRERLGEVAEVPAGGGVELLGVQPQRRGDAQQPFHQVAGALLLADDRQRRDEPEGADQEAALLAGHAVVGLVGAVAQHEAVLGQLVGDRQHARRAGARRRAPGSRRSPPAAWRRRARRCRSAGAGRRRGEPAGEDVGAGSPPRWRPRPPGARRPRASPRAWRRGPLRPST